MLTLVQYTGDEPSGSLEAKELDANRRRITKVFFYFLFKIKCLKTYRKAFPFNACGGMGLGGWVFCSGGQNGGQAPIVRADGRGGQGGRRLGGHLLLGLEPFHRPSLVAGWESAAWSRAKPGSHRSSCTTVASENMRGWEPTTTTS